jgi:Eukaryotic membrane protein family
MSVYLSASLTIFYPRVHGDQPVLTVMVSEMLVDWLKHAFITKFNHIRPSVYERYTDVLCRDLSSGSAVGRRGARKVLATVFST